MKKYIRYRILAFYFGVVTIPIDLKQKKLLLTYLIDAVIKKTLCHPVLTMLLKTIIY